MNAVEQAVGNRRKRRGSFTLIELLVVVAIILLLLGMSLKIMAIVNRKAATAKTIWILEQVKNALGAYYVAYGSYPPVGFVSYEYERTPGASLPAIPTNMNWSTGLVYYIYSEAKHNPEPEAARWQHYLENIGGKGMKPYSNRVGAAWVFWSNNVHTIADAWGAELRYTAAPPDYQSYQLWSVGADGNNANGGGDDIGVQAAE